MALLGEGGHRRCGQGPFFSKSIFELINLLDEHLVLLVSFDATRGLIRVLHKAQRREHALAHERRLLVHKIILGELLPPLYFLWVGRDLTRIAKSDRVDASPPRSRRGTPCHLALGWKRCLSLNFVLKCHAFHRASVLLWYIETGLFENVFICDLSVVLVIWDHIGHCCGCSRVSQGTFLEAVLVDYFGVARVHLFPRRSVDGFNLVHSLLFDLIELGSGMHGQVLPLLSE